MLLDTKADYTIAEPVRISYYINKNNINNLHIAGNFPYDYKLRIATRNDIPIINIILNKAIENITPTDKKALALKWGYEKEIFFDKKLLINILIVATIIIIFLIYLSVLNRKLKIAQNSLKEINSTLKQKIKIEVEKNRAKELIMLNQSRFAQMGQIINMITHQWRQPLNTLSLINHTIFSKYKKDKITENELKELKEKANLQIQQMSNTIDDFKDFFKPKKEKSIFLLNDIIHNLLNIVKPIFNKSKIEIVTIQTQDIYVEGYSNELAQAILNILYNAKDALIENKIEAKLLVIELKEKDNKAILSIKDNAGGIPEDIIQDIFNSYFSTKGKNGTGIGLYISKIIIEQHMHGKIIAINENDGAIFQIELDKALKPTN